MRVAVLADCHIDQGHHGYWATEAWESAIGYVKDHEVDALLIAGDTFKDGKPIGAALKFVSEGMEEAVRAGCEVLMILGNHEMIRAGGGDRRWPSAMVLGKIPGVRMVAEPELVTLNSGLQIAALPWPDAGAEQQPVSAARLAEQIKPDGPRMLLGHTDITGGAVRGSETELPVVTGSATAAVSDIDVPEAFSASLLGHIHIRHSFSDTCGYVGSLEALGFHDEGRVGGFSVLEWNDDSGRWSHEFQQAGVRSFVTVTLEEIAAGNLDQYSPDTLMRVRLMPGETFQMVDREEFSERGLHLLRVMPPKEKKRQADPRAELFDELSVPKVQPEAWKMNVWEHLDKWMDDNSVAPEVRPLLREFCQENYGWTEYVPTQGVDSEGWDDIWDASDADSDSPVGSDWSTEDGDADDLQGFATYTFSADDGGEQEDSSIFDRIDSAEEDAPGSTDSFRSDWLLDLADVDGEDTGFDLADSDQDEDPRSEHRSFDLADSDQDEVLGWAVLDAADDWIADLE